MRKDRIYNLLMSIDQNCYDTTAGSCDCPCSWKRTISKLQTCRCAVLCIS